MLREGVLHPRRYLGVHLAAHQTVRLHLAGGITATRAMPELMQTMAGIPEMLGVGEESGADIEAGEHPGHLSTVTKMGATADHIVAASAAVGVDGGLPTVVQAYYMWACEHGYGGDNWTRIIDAMRPQNGAAAARKA